MAADSRPGRVTVFGGSGFLGGEIVKRLVAEGITVRVAVRHPDDAATDERSGRGKTACHAQHLRIDR